MNDFNKIKYKVNDLEIDINRIKNILPKSKCIDKNANISGDINIFTGASVSTGEIAYEITVIGGLDISATLKINDEIVISNSNVLSCGSILVMARKKNSIELNVSGTGLIMARLKLTGAGLRLI